MAVQLSPSNDASTSIPPRTALLRNITHQTHLLQTIFQSLSSSNTTAPQTSSQIIPESCSSLEGYTKEMQILVGELWDHQAAYRTMKRKEEQVRVLENRVKDLLTVLEEGRRELETMVLDSKGDESSPKSSIPVSTLLSHARLLAKHSSAPTSQHMPQSEKAIYKPYPTETSMRQGILFIEGGGAMPGLGDIEEVLPGEVQHGIGLDGDIVMQSEDIQEEKRERRNVPAVFNLDLNSDSDDD